MGRLFWAYIRQKRRGISAFLLFCAVFFVTFALYRLPLRSVMYPALLCFLLGAVMIAADFRRVWNRHRRLLDIQNLTAAMVDRLPEPDGVEDEDYQTIVRALQRENAALQTAADARYEDMISYYTVWAHQIKTPIASMRLTLQNEDSFAARRLSFDLFRIEQYVEMVLAFLRLDSEATDYVFAEHRLDDILKEAIAKFAPEFIDRKIRLEYEPTDATVVTDDKWLSFVVEQVLSNALKYTEQGSITIAVCAPQTLCITDTGIGIAPEDLPRIFDKGYTGYNGRRDKRATGIGLYLCRRICRNLSADIQVSSAPGQGTTVSIDLEQIPLKTE